jgi:hypothetical protein
MQPAIHAVTLLNLVSMQEIEELGCREVAAQGSVLQH